MMRLQISACFVSYFEVVLWHIYVRFAALLLMRTTTVSSSECSSSVLPFDFSSVAADHTALRKSDLKNEGFLPDGLVVRLIGKVLMRSQDPTRSKNWCRGEVM